MSRYGCCRAFDTFHVLELARPYYIDDWNNVYIFENNWLRMLPVSHDGYVTLEIRPGGREGWEWHERWMMDNNMLVRFRRNSNLFDINVFELKGWVDILEEEGWANHLLQTFQQFPRALREMRNNGR